MEGKIDVKATLSQEKGRRNAFNVEARIRAFLKELGALSRKYGISIGACPGAGYPWLDIEPTGIESCPDCEYVVGRPEVRKHTRLLEASGLQYTMRKHYFGLEDDIWEKD